MFELSQAFHRARRRRNRAPIILFTLKNAFGARVYADRRPDEASAGLAAPAAADGRFLADGGRLAGWGSLPLLERSARVLAYGRLRESLAPLRGELWANLQQEEAGALNVELSNAGPDGARPFSRMEALENLLGAAGELCLGYAEVPPRQWLTRFRGQVTAYRLEAERVVLSLRAW
ncbi:MAG: hypothetical protein ACOZHQ_05995 [Thermodesulfobacteriota bacterium]